MIKSTNIKQNKSFFEIKGYEDRLNYQNIRKVQNNNFANEK
jgi:hypothetical protein